VIDEDIKANLNLADADKDDEDSNNNNGTDIDNLLMESTMSWLLDAIRARLSMKISQQPTGPATNPWFVPYLKNHNFWIRAEAAQTKTSKSGSQRSSGVPSAHLVA
jgi:hypothetical protein